MGFILVLPGPKRVPLKLVTYPTESDEGPYPIPDDAPIENWPLGGRTLASAQTAEERGDRHVLVVDLVNLMLYEFYQEREIDNVWQAAWEATFDLKTSTPQPDGWTSSDVAGLPTFPAVIRFDECQRGLVEHAMRFTVRRTRRAYFVADNGGDWRLSAAPDGRIKGLDDHHIVGRASQVDRFIPRAADETADEIDREGGLFEGHGNGPLISGWFAKTAREKPPSAVE
jgi:hypothetical protein